MVFFSKLDSAYRPPHLALSLQHLLPIPTLAKAHFLRHEVTIYFSEQNLINESYGRPHRLYVCNAVFCSQFPSTMVKLYGDSEYITDGNTQYTTSSVGHLTSLPG